LTYFVRQPASVAADPARPKDHHYGSDMMPLCRDSGGDGAIHAKLEVLDAGIKPIWCYAWFVVEAGVVALMLAFQGLAALPIVVAQFVVNTAMFLFSFQALPDGRSLPVPEAVMVVTVSAEARLRRRRRDNYGRMVFESKIHQS